MNPRPWRRWYSTKAWELLRGRQLALEPLCAECLKRGEYTVATAADHIVPHRGDRDLFFHGKLQSLCEKCHSIVKQREELKGFSDAIGPEGWPVDPRHPFNKR
jgi:5-methylcytosine-specific restriction protein A